MRYSSCIFHCRILALPARVRILGFSIDACHRHFNSLALPRYITHLHGIAILYTNVLKL